jgi:hypothetical protein
MTSGREADGVCQQLTGRMKKNTGREVELTLEENLEDASGLSVDQT